MTNEETIRREIERLHFKKDKTVEEWVELLGRPNYRYLGGSLTRDVVLDYLLGSSFTTDWNERGFIIFEKEYMERKDWFKPDKELEEEAEENRKLEEDMELIVKHVADDPSKLENMMYHFGYVKNQVPKEYFESHNVPPWSNMRCMPENAHPSYIKAGIEIATKVLTYQANLNFLLEHVTEDRKKSFHESIENAKEFLRKWEN